MRISDWSSDVCSSDLLIEHGRRLRALMRYVPRSLDHGLVEALALTGALDPDLDTAGRHSAAATAATWLNAAERALTGGAAAVWTVQAVEGGGYTTERRRRGGRRSAGKRWEERG